MRAQLLKSLGGKPALAAIDAGKHVVVEKPLEVILERADLMIDRAAQAGMRYAGTGTFR